MSQLLSILIVEDDLLYQEYYLDLFDRECNLSFCKTVSTAINLAHLTNPDILLVDLELPDGNGVDAIKQIRLDLSEQKPAILVATSNRNSEVHTIALNSGADAIVQKPFTDDDLRSVLCRYLS